jgi:hypothetical protein
MCSVVIAGGSKVAVAIAERPIERLEIASHGARNDGMALASVLSVGSPNLVAALTISGYGHQEQNSQA